MLVQPHIMSGVVVNPLNSISKTFILILDGQNPFGAHDQSYNVVSQNTAVSHLWASTLMTEQVSWQPITHNHPETTITISRAPPPTHTLTHSHERTHTVYYILQGSAK